MHNETNPSDSRDRGRSGSGQGSRDKNKRSGKSGRGQQQRSTGWQSKPDTKPETKPETKGEDVVLVQFKGHRKGYYNNYNKVELKVGQYCLVEADRGRDMGRITYIGQGNSEWMAAAKGQSILSVATEADLARLHDNRGDEWEFWDICHEKIVMRRLQMNLVAVERQFDHKKITFFFTADKRVDFRELVRDLAGIFRTRIELRQIGVRDEARLKGGLGICGREFCCSSFLHEFVPVTLKMAKVQQLPLNPGKLSGPCGRLRCCLTYENETYQETRRRLPRLGTKVSTPDGRGTVRKLDLVRMQVWVTVIGMDSINDYSPEDLKWDGKKDLPEPKAKPESGCSGGGCGKNKDGGC